MRSLFGYASGMLLVLGAFIALPARAQMSELSLTTLRLDDLEAFNSPASSWQVAGSVYADRRAEWNLAMEQGTGILVNKPVDGGGQNLSTKWEHGDIELSLDFMMSKGSDSGLFLQGRYEVQLAGREGGKPPTYAASGGIYPKKPDSEGYQGHAPRMNVGRAPGLWQHLRVVFKAPEFNSKGKKTENARFVKVVLNGVVIHRDVEVTGATKGAPFQEESPTGPLVLQGTGGPLAVRKIRYKRFGEKRVTLKDLSYEYYEGKFSGPGPGENPAVWTGPYEGVYYEADFEGVPDSLEVQREGSTETLTQEVALRSDDFGLEFSGLMEIPQTGTYFFKPEAAGAARLVIGGSRVADSDEAKEGTIDLEAGAHPFTFTYTKSQKGGPALALHVEGPNMPRHELTELESMPDRQHLDPILVEPSGSTDLIRGFAKHGETLRKHAIFVGGAEGIHYSYDLRRAALLKVWKGQFVNMGFVWQGRGRQRGSKHSLAHPHPQGSVVRRSGKPSVAFLDSKTAPWPDSLTAQAGYQFEGYTLDDGGRPVYMYQLGDINVHDRISVNVEERGFTRKLAFVGPSEEDIWVRLASAERIDQLPEGSYAINDRSYYLDIEERGRARLVLRTMGDQEELLVHLSLDSDRTALKYSTIW